MDNFKQWHDSDLVFHKEFKLSFGQCGKNHLLSLQELLLLTSDTAVEDYAQRGITWKFLYDHDYAILVSRVSFKINRLPEANEYITINTHEEPTEGLQLIRHYEIRSGIGLDGCNDKQENTTAEANSSGDVLVSGRSSWLVVNPKTRRIIPAKQFTLREAPTHIYDYDGILCGKIPIPIESSIIEKRIIKYSDIDGNGHVNNSRYGAYIYDALPLELQNKKLTDIRLNYSKEAVMGDNLEVFGSSISQVDAINSQPTKQKICIAGRLTNETCFESELFFTTPTIGA